MSALSMPAGSLSFAGVRVRDEDVGSAVEMLHEHALGRYPVAVHLCNSFTLTLAAKDSEYAQLLSHRAENLPDGTPVTWFGRLQSGRPQRGPVRGPSLMRASLMRQGFKHFLLGGTDEMLVNLKAFATSVNPQVEIVGSFAPEFRPVRESDFDAYAEEIAQSGANVVWVGLGTPKQDVVLAALVDRVDAVIVGVGAAFDFLSGSKQEAPRVLWGTGLEWLHRLAHEPGRLWRRYLLGNLSFLRFATAELRKRPGKREARGSV